MGFYRLIKQFSFALRGKKYKVPKGAISSYDGNNLSIGKNVSFGGNVFLFGTAPITIGDDTMIAYGTIIHTSTHDHTVHPMRTIRIDRPVSIGKHVWIGTGAIILPGVKIGDYAVVGAGSVVNRHVAEGAVVAGNPAKIVKFRDLSALKMVSEQILTLGFLPDRVVCKDFTNK